MTFAKKFSLPSRKINVEIFSYYNLVALTCLQIMSLSISA